MSRIPGTGADGDKEMDNNRLCKGSMEPPLKREGVRSRTSCRNQKLGKGKESNYQKEPKEQVVGEGSLKRLQSTGAGINKKDKNKNAKKRKHITFEKAGLIMKDMIMSTVEDEEQDNLNNDEVKDYYDKTNQNQVLEKENGEREEQTEQKGPSNNTSRQAKTNLTLDKPNIYCTLGHNKEQDGDRDKVVHTKAEEQEGDSGAGMSNGTQHETKACTSYEQIEAQDRASGAGAGGHEARLEGGEERPKEQIERTPSTKSRGRDEWRQMGMNKMSSKSIHKFKGSKPKGKSKLVGTNPSKGQLVMRNFLTDYLEDYSHTKRREARNPRYSQGSFPVESETNRENEEL